MSEEGYKPNGWLAILLGKETWFSGWNEAVLSENFPQILERLRVPPRSVNPTLASSSSFSSQTEIEAIKSRLNALETKLDQLSESLTAKLDQLFSLLEKN